MNNLIGNKPLNIDCFYKYNHHQDIIQIYGEPSLYMRNGTDWPTSLSSNTTTKENINTLPMSIEKIYPCPANDFIKCVLSVTSENIINITIYDISGRLVNETTANVDKQGIFETIINTNELSNGVYMLNATCGLESATKRFVIVR